MATPTYRQLIDELLPLYEAQHDRFMRFYDAVWLMLYNMPEGTTLNIAERCKPADRDLFFKVACLIMMSDMPGREYYFVDDAYTIIRRGYVYAPNKTNRSTFHDK